jgi:1,4-alpha-glucan branching enzyme
LQYPRHLGIQRLVQDLNRVYVQEHALHQRDVVSTGFRWVVGDDTENSVFAFLRYGNNDARPILVVSNMTPIPRSNYGIGVPRPGAWRELLNSDAEIYGGSNMGNSGVVNAVPVQRHGEAQALELTLPPLATLYLAPDPV